MVGTSGNALLGSPYLGGHCENKRKVKTVRDRVILKNKLSRLGHTKFLSLLSPKNLIAQT